MNTVGERIKFARKKAGLTQTDIYKLTGISSGNLSDIENNKTMPSSTTLISLSRELETSIDWLLTGDEFHHSKNVGLIKESQTSSYSGNIGVLEKFEQLTKEEQTKIEGIIEGFLLSREMHSDKRTTSSNSTNGEEAATSETA